MLMTLDSIVHLKMLCVNLYFIIERRVWIWMETLCTDEKKNASVLYEFSLNGF